jgi:hypothetical protein
MSARVPLPSPPERQPDVEDAFTGPLSDLWIEHYLPHWTTPQRSAARSDLVSGGRRLRIDDDQLDWRPEEDAPLRVSNLQTGTFSGPHGSTRGTHRHRADGLVVRTPTPTRLLWAPSAGRLDITVSATEDVGCMLAVWLVGTEHLAPDQAGEICVFEIDADAIGTDAFRARCGVKAHDDPRLTTDMAEVQIPLDATRPHTWTAVWGAGETVIGCDGVVVRRIAQAPEYPLFLMVDLFELDPSVGPYPKTATIHHFRGWDTSGA